MQSVTTPLEGARVKAALDNVARALQSLSTSFAASADTLTQHVVTDTAQLAAGIEQLRLEVQYRDGAETTVEAIKKLSKLVAVGQTQSTNLITLFSSLPANLAALNGAIERVSISCTTSMSKIEELGSILARLETIQLALTTDLSLDQQRGTQRTHELEDRVQERMDSLLQGQFRFQDDCEARMVNLEKSLLEGNKRISQQVSDVLAALRSTSHAESIRTTPVAATQPPSSSSATSHSHSHSSFPTSAQRRLPSSTSPLDPARTSTSISPLNVKPATSFASHRPRALAPNSSTISQQPATFPFVPTARGRIHPPPQLTTALSAPQLGRTTQGKSNSLTPRKRRIEQSDDEQEEQEEVQRVAMLVERDGARTDDKEDSEPVTEEEEEVEEDDMMRADPD